MTDGLSQEIRDDEVEQRIANEQYQKGAQGEIALDTGEGLAPPLDKDRDPEESALVETEGNGEMLILWFAVPRIFLRVLPPGDRGNFFRFFTLPRVYEPVLFVIVPDSLYARIFLDQQTDCGIQLFGCFGVVHDLIGRRKALLPCVVVLDNGPIERLLVNVDEDQVGRDGNEKRDGNHGKENLPADTAP